MLYKFPVWYLCLIPGIQAHPETPAHSLQNDLALFYCPESVTFPGSSAARLLTVCAAEAPAVRALLQVNHWLPYKYMAEPEIEVLLRNREIQRRLQMVRHGIPCSLTA